MENKKILRTGTGAGRAGITVYVHTCIIGYINYEYSVFIIESLTNNLTNFDDCSFSGCYSAVRKITRQVGIMNHCSPLRDYSNTYAVATLFAHLLT